MPETQVEVVDDRIKFDELILKPDGSVNRNTGWRLVDLARLLFKGLRFTAEDEEDIKVESVHSQLTRLLDHQLTLGQTFEGQEILDAMTEVKAAIEVLNTKMAAVKGLKYTINQGE